MKMVAPLIERAKLYIHVPVAKLIGHLDEFLGLGVNGQIYISSEFIDNHSREETCLINSSFKRHGLIKTIHSPFMDLNPGSSDRKIREATQSRFMDTVEFADQFMAKSITFHSHFEPVFYKKYLERWIENSFEVWDKVVTAAEGKGINIHIENSIDQDPCAIIELLKRHIYFGACFDVAHYNAFSNEGWPASLNKYPLGSIKEVHLSDNNGDEDSHMPLGEGKINFEGLFSEIHNRGEDPIYIIESHSRHDVVKSVEFISTFLK